MKLTLKKIAFTLGLGLGLGISASAFAFAYADPFECELWEIKCTEGNERACALWTINCQDYGGV